MENHIVEAARFSARLAWMSEQMNSRIPNEFDVLIVGGGPAGIAAAVSASECGVRVGIVDDNPTLGGQIWRQSSEDTQYGEAGRWLQVIRAQELTTLYGMKIVHQPEAGVLLAEGMHDSCELRYRNLVLATGARECFLPFPGWTLPNVMGAGGLQALVKSGLPIRGRRVVVAGSGPLLLAVAAYLRKCGAEIPVICEQASWSSLTRFATALIGQPAKIMQALRLKREIAGIPFAANSWPLAAHGQDTLERVTISRAGKTETIECDYLACGFHLVPNTELAALLRCELRGGYVQVNELQQTTVPGIFCAGEPTGIGGVELSLTEGQIAGFAAGGRPGSARKLFGTRQKLRYFARSLDQSYGLRDELRKLPADDTI
ncbi:MAG TPA: FAD/NAD(P)-binding oxidoreductase, partial [Candidatus Binatia bacterium]|nr:FAD/NAD(P)-binding oxidoreductase [Candidatus Binatia bacterium]